MAQATGRLMRISESEEATTSRMTVSMRRPKESPMTSRTETGMSSSRMIPARTASSVSWFT